MRIEAYNQVASLYKSTKNTKTQGTSKIGARDEVQFSQAGRDFQVAKKAVEASPDIREGKVARLKAQIESGEYKVSAGDFASKLLAKYEQGV